MQFDVILTNPPFQDAVQRNKTPHKLWIDFTLAVFDRLLCDGGSLLQVSPSSFSSPSNVVLTLMENHQTMVLRFDKEGFFPGVASTFSDYWIKKIPNDPTPTTVVTAVDKFEVELDRSMSYLPNDVGRVSLAIHSKVVFSTEQKLRVEWDYVTAHNIRRFDPTPTLVEERSDRHPYPVFHTNRSTWWSSVRQPWADEQKVMWTRSGYTKPFFDDRVHGGTDMVYYVRVDDGDEGRALASNLNTELLRYIYRTAKWSGFGNERVFCALPELPRDRALTDDEMFAFFELTGEEVDHVRRALAPRRRKA